MTIKKEDMEMGFKKFISYFNIKDSIKEIELNSILDKISVRMKLSSNEKYFLNHYNDIKDDDIKEYRMLSVQYTFEVIKKLMDNNKTVICNLIDRDGIINTEVKSIYSDYESGKYILTLKHEEKVEMKDNYLYNLIYILKKNHYSLEASDEFYEKIKV